MSRKAVVWERIGPFSDKLQQKRWVTVDARGRICVAATLIGSRGGHSMIWFTATAEEWKEITAAIEQAAANDFPWRAADLIAED